METRTHHPEHPKRELALQLAVSYGMPHDTADSIVARADKYAEFLNQQ
jgi:hypothetical protein